jgi:peroxiredoxin
MPSSPRCDFSGTRSGGRRARRLPPKGILALAVLFAILAAAAGAFGEEKPAAPLPETRGPEAIRLLEPGAMAPDFRVKDIAGETFHFEVENAKYPYLLVFWSMFCEPCRLQLAIVQNLYEKYGDAGLRVAAVGLDGEPMKNVVAGFARQEGYTFQVLIDELDAREQFKIADPYGVSGMPSTFLIGRGGRIALGRVGLVKGEELEKSLQSVLKP